jgi:hypothetical protein
MARNDPPALQCQHPGCTNSTRERKPFCTEHVSDHPYVLELMGQIQEVEKELARVARRGTRAVEIEGIPAQEIMRELRTFGHRTVERLARDLRLEPEVVASYGRALNRAGRVSLAVNSRGVTMLSLPDHKARAAGA